MPIQEDLNARMKDAMRARDKQLLGLIRMLKSKMGEKTTGTGFSGEVDDALWVDVISSYAKSQQKALVQFEAADRARADEHIEQIKWELSAVEEWLPKKADEATVRGWVQEAVDGLGGPGAHFGAVMGSVIKAHKGEVDPGMVRKIVEEVLN
jgi:uncharacterized protein YqeY